MSEDLVPYDARTQIERALPAKDALKRATDIAEVLAPVIEKRRLFVQIGDKRHVLFEGWTTLGALCGPLIGETVSAVVAWTKPIEGGFEARVEAITYSGRVVGAAEAQCTREESRWADADDYAIRSMAQTRAGSKAMRMPLGWIMQLSGFETTPAEEMDGVRPEARRPMQGPATPKQIGAVKAMLGKLGYDGAFEFLQAHAPDLLVTVKDQHGVERTNYKVSDLSKQAASDLIEALKKGETRQPDPVNLGDDPEDDELPF